MRFWHSLWVQEWVQLRRKESGGTHCQLRAYSLSSDNMHFSYLISLFIYLYIYIYIYILGCFFRPLLFQIPTANSPLEDFGEKITPAKFREKILTFHLAAFALKFMKSLTNQNFQNVARTLIFFLKRSLSKSRIAT